MNAKDLICTAFLTDVNPNELYDVDRKMLYDFNREKDLKGLVYKVVPEDMDGNATWWNFSLYFDTLGPVLKCWLYEGNYLGWIQNTLRPLCKEKLFIHIHNFFEDGDVYKEKDPSEWVIKVEELK